MKRFSDTTLLLSLIAPSFFVVGGLVLKIQHISFGNYCLGTGVAFALLFMSMCAYEIFTQSHLSKAEKISWLLVVVLGNTLGGLLYFLIVHRHLSDKT